MSGKNLRVILHDSRNVAIQKAINLFSYDFVINDDANLMCKFCKLVFETFDDNILKNHVESMPHRKKCVTYDLEKRFNKGLLKVSFSMVEQKLEQIAEDVMKLESASDLRIETMSKEQFELQIASKLNNLTSQQLVSGKLEKVKYALNNKLFVDHYLNTVLCVKCNAEINDSLSIMSSHLDNCYSDYNSLIPVIDWKVSETLIPIVNSQKYLSFSSEKDTVKCHACKDSFQCHKPTILKHLSSQNHAKCVQLFENSVIINNSINSEDFTNWLGLTLSSSNISFNLVKSLENLFQSFLGRNIPCEGTFRNHLPKMFDFLQAKVKEEIGDNEIYLSMDEAKVTSLNLYFVSIIVGTLCPDSPEQQKHFVFNYEVLEDAWTGEKVIQLFEQTLQQLYGVLWAEKTKTKLKLFLTDGASQMVFAGKRLSKQYPNMLFLICLCHNLHNLCETIIKKFPNVSRFITSLNNILYASPARMDHFLSTFNLKKRPVKAVLTRWGTWLDSCEYWYHNFNFACSFLSTLPAKSKEADYIVQAKNLANIESTKTELEFIYENYCFISKVIHKLEQRNQSIENSIKLVKSVEEGLNKQSDTIIGKELIERFAEIRKKNSGYQLLVSGLESSNPELNPLKFAPIGSYEAERANKIFKSTYSSDRAKLSTENARKKAYIRFNSISLGMRDIKVKNAKDNNRLQPQLTTTKRLSFSNLFINSDKLLTKRLELPEIENSFSIDEIDEQLNLELDYYNDEDDFPDI